MVVNHEEGIRPLNAFYCALRVPSYSLEEASHLVGLGRGPGGGVLWVFVELSILHEVARLFIEYWKGHVIGSCCVLPGMVIDGRLRRLWVWWRCG